MKRFLFAVAVLTVLPLVADAGPIRDRLAKLFRPATPAPAAVAAPAAPVAKTMPKAAGQSPGCCCKDCQCNKPAAPAKK